MKVSYTKLKKFEELEKAIERGWSTVETIKEEFEGMVFNLPVEPNEYMVKGSELHEKVAKERYKMDYFTDEVIYEDKSKWINYYKYDFSDLGVVISLVIDVLDLKGKTITDWKFSTKVANQQDSKQIYLYMWICELMGLEIEKGYLVQMSYDCEVLTMAEFVKTEEHMKEIKDWFYSTVERYKKYLLDEYGIKG